MKYSFTEGKSIAGGGALTRVFNLAEPGIHSPRVTAVWWYPDSRRAQCTACSGPLQAMLSTCKHAKALRRHMERVEPPAAVSLAPSPPQAVDIGTRLHERYGVTQDEVRAAVKPLFMFMFDHGIDAVSISRDDKKATLTIDGFKV